MGNTNLKNRLIKSSPVFSDLLKNQNLIGQQLVAGAVAGDVAVSGVKKGDNLVAVIDITTPADLTSEFTITADGIINNTGGTSTDAKNLIVTYEQWILR